LPDAPVAVGDGQLDDLFEQMIEIIWESDSRVPKPITKAVGSAIYRVVGHR
jgi:hypothetical protein